MSCSAPPRELITFWLAGSLSPADAALVSSHVESCAECRLAAVEGLAVVKGFSELHLAADEVVAAAAGDLESPHVLVCSRCRDEVALLRTINADLTRASGRIGWVARLVDRREPALEERARSEGLPAQPAPRWRPIGHPAHAARSPQTWVRWGLAVSAIAAALMVAVLVFPLRTGSPPIGSDRESSAQDASAPRAVAPPGSPAAVALIEPGEMAVGVPKRFRWEPVGAGSAYHVVVFKEDGKQVWSSPDQAGLQIDTPDSLVLARGIYFWQVAALKDGRVVAESKLSQFQVR